ncbi:MAG: hypothetical protein P8Z36_08150 [Gemmatimonadota bacterium]
MELVLHPDAQRRTRWRPFSRPCPAGHLFEPQAAGAIRSAVDAAIRAGETTPDLGGALSTAAVGDRVCDQMGT